LKRESEEEPPKRRSRSDSAHEAALTFFRLSGLNVGYDRVRIETGSAILSVVELATLHTSAYVSIRQRTSAYVSIRQHTSAYVRQALAARAEEAQPGHKHVVKLPINFILQCRSAASLFKGDPPVRASSLFNGSL
jgi:hypothetical protein